MAAPAIDAGRTRLPITDWSIGALMVAGLLAGFAVWRWEQFGAAGLVAFAVAASFVREEAPTAVRRVRARIEARRADRRARKGR